MTDEMDIGSDEEAARHDPELRPKAPDDWPKLGPDEGPTPEDDE